MKSRSENESLLFGNFFLLLGLGQFALLGLALAAAGIRYWLFA